MKQIIIFLFIFISVCGIHARPLIFALDGGQERNKPTAAFNEVVEYVAVTRTIPLVVSGAILEQYERTCPGALRKLLSHFCCFKRANENIFIIAPLISPVEVKKTKKYSAYELGIGLKCEHQELCTEIRSVDEWIKLLKLDEGNSWGSFEATLLSSLLIREDEYEDQVTSPWIIYMAGHGIYRPTEARSAAAGIHLKVLKDFITHLVKDNACALLVLDTCHAGGHQARRFMAHMEQCEKKYGAKKSFPLVIIGLTHDIVYSSNFPYVKKSLDGLLRGAYASSSKKNLANLRVLERALKGFIDDALGIYTSWSPYTIPASHNFFKVTKTPQVRLPSDNQWHVLPVGTRHVMSVATSDPLKITDDVTVVLIKKGVKPHLELMTKNRIIFISECADNEVCSIHRIKAPNTEFSDFLRYGFFDLIEPHAELVFKIDELVALENGKEMVFSDVLITKKHQHKLEGTFGAASFKKAGKRYHATIGWFKHGPHDLKIPAHAVEKLEIIITQET